MTHQEKLTNLKSSKPTIHRGPWVITGLTAKAETTYPMLIEDGALVIADGLIKAVGKYKNIAREFGQFDILEHENSVLAPALINGHCHLELSYMDIAGRTAGQRKYNGDPTEWIRDLLAEREKFSQDTCNAEEQIMSQARQMLQQLSVEGTAFVGDVGNSLASRFIGDDQGIRVFYLLELLGLTQESEMKSFTRLEHAANDKSLAFSCTAHAPYSTTPALIRAIKKQSLQNSHIFSIHVAESRQEVEFLQTGRGAFREFLCDRGAWDNSFTIPGKGSVHYLDSLGVIDSKTLCVHGVHVERGEIEILAKKRAKVCLCPGSNRFLGVGKAPVTEFLAHGILPALGTDSKASNGILSMWREMRMLREDNSDLFPEAVFAMATLGGAEAWGVDAEMGSLESGKRALVLAINCKDKIYSTKEVFEYLTTAGASVQVEWLD